MKRTNLKKLILVLLTLIAVITIFAACSKERGNDNENNVAGSLLLSINPEIKVEYDREGNVLSVKGMNEDGVSLINNENEFNGKSCNEAVKALVSRIYDAGYFVDEIEGNTKNIVIKLEEGSEYPTEAFLENIEENVKAEVDRLGLDSSPVTIDKEDYDENGRISLEKAKEIALTQLGLTDESIDFRETDIDREDNSYELEFAYNGFEYEVEVDADNGKVIRAGFELGDEDYGTSSEETTPVTDPDVQPDSSDVKISLETAKSVALEYAGLTEADFIKCEDSEDGDEYDIKFIADGIEYDVEVNAYTGTVTDFDKEIDDDHPVNESEHNPVPEQTPDTSPDTAPEIPEKVRLTPEEAKSIALLHAGIEVPDRIFCEEDEDDYDIEFTYDGIEYEVEINAISGEVTDFNTEREDD